MRILAPRLLIVFALLAIFTASCVGAESRPAVAPPPAVDPGMPFPTNPTLTMEEKVVSLATLTGVPTFDPSNPGPTPTAVDGLPGSTPAPTRTPLAPSDSLEGMGLEMGMIADPLAGIQLSFPAGWSVTPVDEETKAKAAVYVTGIESPPEAVPSGIPMSLALTVQKGPYTYEKAINLRMVEFQNIGWKVESELPLTLPSGEAATIWRVDTPEGKIAQMVTVIDENIILLTGMGDLFLFDPIAASLQQLTDTKPGG